MNPGIFKIIVEIEKMRQYALPYINQSLNPETQGNNNIGTLEILEFKVQLVVGTLEHVPISCLLDKELRSDFSFQ